MTTLVLVARFVLAGVFLVSGFAKLADRAGTRAAVAGFGVPTQLRPFVASVLAPVELVVAAGLLATGPVVTVAAVAAGALLVAFTVAVVASLAQDRTVACHCFGTVSNRPVTWLTVVRNLALLAVDAVVLAGGLHQPWPWQGLADAASGVPAQNRWLWAVVLAAVAALGVLAGLFWVLLRRYGEVLNRLDALEADTATLRGSAHAHGHDHGHDHGPSFEPYPLPDHLADQIPGHVLTLLVSVSPNCAACGELAGELQAWADDASGPPLVVVSPGSPAEIRAKLGDLPVLRLPGDDDASTLGLAYTPGAVVVEHGHVVSPPSYGAEEIRALHAGLVGGATALGPGPGTPLPDVTVLTGVGEVSATDAVARAAEVGLTDDPAAEVVVLLWDTTCGFCQQVADEVAQLSQQVATLVVLRDRDLPALRAAGVDGPLALDPAFALGSALGAPGTPSAVLVRDGVVASTLAVGGPEVVALLAGQVDAGIVTDRDRSALHSR